MTRGPLRGLAVRLRRAPALATGVCVALVAAVLLTATHHVPTARPTATVTEIEAALRVPAVARAVAHRGWDSTAVAAINGGLVRVAFFRHRHLVADVALLPGGQVARGVALHGQPLQYGDWIAWEPAVLVGLTALFLLFAGVAPLRRLRNFDALVMASLLAPALLLRADHLGGAAVAAIPPLLYLGGRCAWLGLGPAPAPAQSTPLFTLLGRGAEQRSRIRTMRLLLFALALVYVMVGVSSPNPIDVAYAVMEGATKLLHGLLPYGHMPGDIVHSDTYPLLSYVLYVPLALVAPVRSLWDQVDIALAFAVGVALLTAATVLRGVAGPRRGRPAAAEEAGLRAALVWLTFPPLLIIVSTGTSDLPLAAMLALAIVLWRRPGWSTGLLAAAAWLKIAPLALLPVWLAPLRGRRLAFALAGVLVVSAPLVGLLVALGGWNGPVAMLRAVSFQFTRQSAQSAWSALGAEQLQPLFQACVLGLIAASAVRLWCDPTLAESRPRMAALAGAILIGLQLTADYWTFLYLSWIVPLVAGSLLAERVAVSEALPAPASRESPAALGRSARVPVALLEAPGNGPAPYQRLNLGRELVD